MVDPASVARPERDRFYDVSYRPQLRKMLDHIVDLEGPIFFDLLVDRLARAHGLQRSGETVRQVVGAALGIDRRGALRVARADQPKSTFAQKTGPTERRTSCAATLPSGRWGARDVCQWAGSSIKSGLQHRLPPASSGSPASTGEEVANEPPPRKN